VATVTRNWEPKKVATNRPQESPTNTKAGAPSPGAPPPGAAATGSPGIAQKADSSGFADAKAASGPPAAAPMAAAAAPRPAPAMRAPRAFDMADLADPYNGSGGGGRGSVDDDRPRGAHPYTGTFKTVMDLIAAKKSPAALEAASKWHAKDPGDVMALVALGEAFEASENVDQAARAYGSLIDLFSSRADLRRFAGERLDRLKTESAIQLSVDTYEKAAEDRPDHPAVHRLLAWAHVRNKSYDKAFAVLEKALKRQYPRFEAADRILREDLAIIAKAWSVSDPEQVPEITRRLKEAHVAMDNGPSLRFVLNWETDNNDVDFHIFDSHGGHAFFSNMELPSGGNLYADITTGYGPECFTIRKGKLAREPVYTLQAHYYSRGPMGYGMGKLQIIDHDGKGGVTIEDRPFVVMVDEAFVNMGTVRR
jgi:tetratricopeptide (TPR) repeat protein